MIEVQWDPEALAELEEATEYHDAESSGRGARFLDRVNDVVEMVCTWPYAGSPIGDEFRRVVILPFPYSLIYVPHPAEIEIVAVVHHKRDPDSWRGRR